MQIIAKIHSTRVSTWQPKNSDIKRSCCIVTLKHNNQTTTVNVYNKYARFFVNTQGNFTCLSIKNKREYAKHTTSTLDSLMWIKAKDGKVIYKQEPSQIKPLLGIKTAQTVKIPKAQQKQKSIVKRLAIFCLDCLSA